jgi:hypothetical protein
MASTITMPAAFPQRNAVFAGALLAMSTRVWLWAALFAAFSAMALTWLAYSANAPAAIADTPRVATNQVADTQRRRCETCGVVEVVRELTPTSATAGHRVEVTIRMRDRSTRISNEAGSGRWFVGDRIQMIGTPAAIAP